MTTIVLTAVFRYRRVILAVVLVLLLFVAECIAREKADNACGPSGPTVSAGGLVYPVDASAPITSGYRTPDRPDHRGVDFGVPEGTPIHALADGTVVAAQDQGVQGFGGWVVLSHVIDGKPASTVYGHINPGGVHVTVGQQVRAGDVIATSGNAGESSGPHLHFELWNGDRLGGGTDTDPTPVLNSIKNGGSSATGGSTGTDQRAAAVAPGADDAVTRNAAAIISAGRADGVPDEAIVIALSVGLVESELHNWASSAVPESQQYPNDGVRPGDQDSVGVLQQRVSMGYGSVKDLMNPEYQAHGFFTRLTATDWQHKDFTTAAADIQRPREDLRGKYGQREAEARELFARVSGHMPAGGSCGPTSPAPGTPAPAGGQGAAIVAAARKQIGLPYVWGGGNADGPTGGGFDCSGLTLYAVHAATGTTLPHYTGDHSQPGQLQQGQPVPDISQAQPGDLLFFGSGNDAEHVGIFEGTVNGVPTTMIHAPTQGQNVTEAPETDGGQLIGIRRYTSAAPSPAAPAIGAAAMPKERR